MTAPTGTGRTRAQLARRMEKALGELTSTAVGRMEREMPWFRELSPEHRSWIGMVLQAGITSFIAWYRDPAGRAPDSGAGARPSRHGRGDTAAPGPRGVVDLRRVRPGQRGPGAAGDGPRGAWHRIAPHVDGGAYSSGER